MNKITHKDYGLSDEDFKTLVDFYYAMSVMVYDAEKRMAQRGKLVSVLKAHAEKKIGDRKKILLEEIKGLEKMAKKFESDRD